MDSVFGTDQFNYDPIGRITGQADPERKYKSYLYDPAGDLLKTKVEPGNEGWSRQGEYEGVRYRFDRVGNLVERTEKQNKTEFVWDANGRLVESVSGGKKTAYQYDPLGRRISKETDGVTTRFNWDGDTLLGDVTGDDTREWVYYPGSFEPLAMIHNEEFYLYHNEPNGCPSRLLDESGKVVWAARYDAWGKVKKLFVDEVEQPLRLQGQYFDGETGLHYNRFRYYSPEIGAFISQDTLGLLAGENVYGFGPNAQMWIDPLGLCKESNQFAKEPFVPNEYWQKHAPEQVSPGTRRLDWSCESGRTGRIEESRVIYDNFGRQKYRIDKTDHMMPLDHSNPHLHERTYNSIKHNPYYTEKRYNF
jgi:RHS repeat-associated protein